MQRLLIANRGEIALRIARTAHELGIETVAVHGPEDEDLARGYGVERLARLPGRGAAAYLDIEALMEAARREGCDALHPGYGFLSESPELAFACEKAGLVFVGPAAATLRVLGDKAAARGIARRLSIPIVPGTDAPLSLEAAGAFFDGLASGQAMVLKAVAGGGGRGMRVVRRSDELAAAFERCRSEAQRSFGLESLFAECYVEDARHIEIQVVVDARGAVSHLGERDCTLQRRHQKLVELAPAPALDPNLRQALCQAACALAGETGLVGVGTFEFLVDRHGGFFFIEANPRLQVEHTVTEAVTGVDLVEIQLRLAEGARLEALGLDTPPPARGFAIQLRVQAERLDETGAAMASQGTLSRFEPPSGPGVRVDTAMRRGLGPHPAFDSLLAKLVVASGSDDPERLLARARRALDDFRIEGLPTNLGLLRALLRHPELARGTLSTTFLAEHAASLAGEAAELEHLPRDTEPDGDRDAATTIPAPPRPQSELPAGLEAVTAPLIGTVLEMGAEEGDAIEAGAPICVLESMKMEHVVAATTAGRVEQLRVAIGDVVQPGDTIAWLRPTETTARADAESEAIDLDHIRPDLAAVLERHALLEDAQRPDAVERRRSRGQRTARENLAELCDPDSFIEYGALAVAAQRRTRPLEELQRKTPADGILTGFGTVNAALFGAEAARCALLVVDATVLAGTQGFHHHHKIDRLLELAEKYATPVVFLPEGGGGRPNDSDPGDISVAGLNVTSFHAFARLSGKVPRVSVVSGFCFAGSAAFAGCSDVIIATRQSSLGMGGPAMIEGGGLGVHAPEDVGPSDVQERGGVIDLLVEDETEGVQAAKRYLSYFQGRLPDWSCRDQRELRHLIPENRRRVYDVRAVIETLCDEGSVLELRRAYGVGMITALIRIEGHPFGLIANDPMHLGGAIDEVGAEKAARFLQLCDAFGLPVLSLCDTPGFMVGPEIETRGQVRKVSRLFVVGASLSVPLFTVVLRKGYGLGAQAMAGGSFVAPFFTIAWPTGEIGGMGLEGAVRLGFQKQLAEIEDPEAREALFQKLVGVLYEKGKALDPAATRQHVLRGLTTVGPIRTGSGRFVDTW
jgi:acetyl/propionyl-CoA carboxylase alpha subunit